MGPNVVILLLDTARADAFEPYGAPRGASPVIADLAADGTAVPLAYAPSNWTIPSHASMFTGLLPVTLGLGQSSEEWGIQCRAALEANQHRLLPSVLQAAGYATAAVSANGWIRPRTGFGIGFDQFRIARGRRYERIQETDVLSRLKWARQAVRARNDDGASNAAALIDQWLDGLDGRPFFLFVNLVECHSPYLPPLPHNSLSPWKRFLAGEEARRHLTLEEFFRMNAGGFDVPDAAIERMRVLYADAIRLMDDWIGRLMGGLADRGLVDDTVVAVTSDHGENLGENELLGHAMSLSDRLIKVPLVLSGPDVRPLDDRPVSLTALPAIIAEAVGLEDHPWTSDLLPEGVAVAQYDGPMRTNRAAAVEFAGLHGLGEEAVQRLTWRQSCATDGLRKVVRREDGSELLFDLALDPTEATPVPVGPDMEVGSDLRQALAVAAESAGPPLGAVRGVDDGGVDDGELDGLEGQMRLLGYL